MLRIRLQRTGRKKTPFYHVVVAEKNAPINGRVVDRLGFYNPLIKPWSFEVDLAKAEDWIKKGAQPTDTVARLLKAAGMDGVDSFIVEMKDRKKKNAPEEEEAPAEAAPSSDEPAEDSAPDEASSDDSKEEKAQEPTSESDESDKE